MNEAAHERPGSVACDNVLLTIPGDRGAAPAPLAAAAFADIIALDARYARLPVTDYPWVHHVARKADG